MPRYHFHFRDGINIPDNEGFELPDLKAAQKAAVEMLGEMAVDDADGFVREGGWTVDVATSDGLILFTAMLNAFGSAARNISAV